MGRAGASAVRLPATLEAWGGGAFPAALKRELRALPAGSLPLQRGTAQGGLVDDSDIAVTLLQATEEPAVLRLRIGVFFTEVVGGCSCGDDPVAANAYCELGLEIDRHDATVRFGGS